MQLRTAPANEERRATISALYVKRSASRQGLGRRLMGTAAKAWEELGGRSLELSVLTANTQALAFYEALGGQMMDGQDIFNWDGHLLPILTYRFDDLPFLSAKTRSLSYNLSERSIS